MVMKIGGACVLLAVLLLSATLVPLPAQAESTALRWTSVDKPGTTGNTVVNPSEVSEIAIGGENVLYAIDSENSKVYRSLNGGVSWGDITPYLVNVGAGLPASKIAVAPDKPAIVAVVTNGGTKVYLSTDGGIDWTYSGDISDGGALWWALSRQSPYPANTPQVANRTGRLPSARRSGGMAPLRSGLGASSRRLRDIMAEPEPDC